MKLAARSGGEGQPLLLLLHGMGANAAVWEPMQALLAAHWPGRWLAPDLRGHGQSDHATPYTLASHVDDVAELISGEARVAVLGHSMGGALGIMLAAQRRPDCAVAAFGVKNQWDADLVGKLHKAATVPSKVFSDAESASERCLLLAGVKGLLATNSEFCQRGVRATPDGWRAALDPAAFAIAGVMVDDVAQSLANRLFLMRAVDDELVGATEWSAPQWHCQSIAEGGHNAHVKAPHLVWAQCADFLRASVA